MKAHKNSFVKKSALEKESKGPLLLGAHKKLSGAHEKLTATHKKLSGAHEKLTATHKKLSVTSEIVDAIFSITLCLEKARRDKRRGRAKGEGEVFRSGLTLAHGKLTFTL
uniref:Uncharacterized protein n=1 Tax=Oryzias melastigma TaxID=30732 RepID=A0A3B3CJX8_ORYME